MMESITLTLIMDDLRTLGLGGPPNPKPEPYLHIYPFSEVQTS